jgi:hypothetical protein
MELAGGLLRTLAGTGLRTAATNMTWRAAAVNGFAPIPPIMVLLPLKIAIFVILLIILLVAGAGWWSLPIAYVGQAVIVMISAVAILNSLISWLAL